MNSASEIEKALRESRAVRRESLESYREQMRELQQSLRELRRLRPGDVSGRVEI